MASMKYFVFVFLALELAAAVRPSHDLHEKATAATVSLHAKSHAESHSSHASKSKLAEEEEGKPCCGCKVKSILGFARSCDGKPGRYGMETCGGERASSCDNSFKMSGDEYSCWTKTSGCEPPSKLP